MRPTAVCRALGLFVAALLPGGTGRGVAEPSPAANAAGRIRSELHALAAERAAAEANSDVITLRSLNQTPLLPDRAARNLAWLRLDNQLDSIRVQVTCTAEDTPTTLLRRTTLVLRGVEWLALPAGAWRIDLLAGRADGQPPLSLPPLRADLKPGRSYGLDFDRPVEAELARRMRATARKPSLETPPEERAKRSN